MKKTLIILFSVFLVTLSACKKDSNSKPGNYGEIKNEHIAALESSMASQAIAAVNASGTLLLKPGDIIVFKTNKGRFGKMQIVSIDATDNYKLTFNAACYDPDGSTYKSKSNVSIRGTWSADLDEIVEESTLPGTLDFFWNRVNDPITNLAPMVGAKFMKYSF